MNTYAAKLLFQFKLTKKGWINKKRRCEIKIFHMQATSAEEALKQFKKLGEEQSHSYLGAEGHDVSYEFIGLKGLVKKEDWWEENQVWEDDIYMIQPSERRQKIIPTDSELLKYCE